jgi:hypothetical protein
MEAICSSETSVDNGLHGVISQKMVLFKEILLMEAVCYSETSVNFSQTTPRHISEFTFVRTSNLTFWIIVEKRKANVKRFAIRSTRRSVKN